MANSSFVRELGRRNVIRVALAYLAGSWLLIQVADTVLPRLGFTDRAVVNVILVLAVGFLPALLLAWIFQWTPQGIQRDTPTSAPSSPAATRRFDRAIIATLVLAVGYFAFDKFVLDPARDASQVQRAREEGRADAFVRAYGNRSIAVLPFVNLSPDPEQEYFSDGIAEELLNLLAKIPELRVISRSTAFTFKGQDIVVPEVAKKLNVAHILEGSVRRSGNRVRITAQLIDAQTDTHLWSETYDREMGDVFAIQDEISAKVVEALKLQLLGGAPSAEQVDPRAYDLYLRGRHLLHRDISADADREALGYLEKVVEMEPEWVPGITELLRAVYRQSNEAPAQRAEYRRRGWALLEVLERADKQGARALGWRGYLTWTWLGDLQLAARYLERSSMIDPENIDHLRGESAFLGELGRYEEALAVAEYLVVNDPGCTPCISNMVFNLRSLGRHREAAERLEKILDWHVPTNSTYWSLGLSWLVAGEPQKALGYFDAMGEPPGQNLGRLMALHDLGREAEFEQEFARYRETNRDHPEGVARAYAWTGQKDEAFEWLDRMVEQDGPEYAGLVKTDLYSKLKDDPRWPAFLERNGQSDEGLEQVEFNPRLPAAITERINRQ